MILNKRVLRRFARYCRFYYGKKSIPERGLLAINQYTCRLIVKYRLWNSFHDIAELTSYLPEGHLRFALQKRLLLLWSDAMATEEGITETAALEMYNSGWYQRQTDEEIVQFQLFEAHWCMPLDFFRAALESVLGREVSTFELADLGYLQKEYETKRQQNGETKQ